MLRISIGGEQLPNTFDWLSEMGKFAKRNLVRMNIFAELTRLPENR
jgi:hypothetical protein